MCFGLRTPKTPSEKGSHLNLPFLEARTLLPREPAPVCAQTQSWGARGQGLASHWGILSRTQRPVSPALGPSCPPAKWPQHHPLVVPNKLQPLRAAEVLQEQIFLMLLNTCYNVAAKQNSIALLKFPGPGAGQSQPAPPPAQPTPASQDPFPGWFLRHLYVSVIWPAPDLASTVAASLPPPPAPPAGCGGCVTAALRWPVEAQVGGLGIVGAVWTAKDIPQGPGGLQAKLLRGGFWVWVPSWGSSPTLRLPTQQRRGHHHNLQPGSSPVLLRLPKPHTPGLHRKSPPASAPW